MYSFNLPMRTQIISGRQRSGKTTTALALCKHLMVETNKEILIITDNLLHTIGELDEYGVSTDNVISTKCTDEIENKYNSVVLLLNAVLINPNTMEFETYYPLSPQIVSYLKSINDKIQKPYVIITAYLNKDSVDLVTHETI